MVGDIRFYKATDSFAKVRKEIYDHIVVTYEMANFKYPDSWETFKRKNPGINHLESVVLKDRAMLELYTNAIKDDTHALHSRLVN